MKIKLIVICLSILTSINIKAQNKDLIQFGNKKAIVYDICFSKGGTMLVVPENNMVNIYETKTQKVLYSFTGAHTKEILSVDISADSSKIVTGGKDSLVVLWDVKTQQVLKKLDFKQGVITSVKFHPEQEIIACGTSGKNVILYDIKSDKAKYTLANHVKDITAITFNSDGRILASASEDKSIIIWETETGEMINKLTEHIGFIRSISFSPDNSRLISCDDKARVIVWKTVNIKNIEMLENEKYGSSWILSSNYYLDNKAFVLGTNDGLIKVISSFPDQTYDVHKPVQKVVFKPNEGLVMKIAVATRGNGVFLLDLRYAKNKNEVKGKNLNNTNVIRITPLFN